MKCVMGGILSGHNRNLQGRLISVTTILGKKTIENMGFCGKLATD